MRMNNLDIYCYRGEVFTLDYRVVNNDGSPYVLPNDGHQAYILFTITSNRYDQANRYVKNIWLKLEGFPSFVNTTILPVSDFTMWPPYSPDGIQYQDDGNEAVYYTREGNKLVYKYYNYNDGEWIDYDFRIVLRVPNSISKEWVEQNYSYSMQLISGEIEDGQFISYSDITYLIQPSKLIVYSSPTGETIPSVDDKDVIVVKYNKTRGTELWLT